MPQLETRLNFEAKLATDLSELMAKARAEAQAGQSVDWEGFRVGVSDTLDAHLAAVFVLVFLLMADEDLTNRTGLADAIGRTFTARLSQDLGRALTDNARSELAAGADPARVFGDGRTRVLVATETTRTISAAELEARRANAGQPSRRGEGGPDGTLGRTRREDVPPAERRPIIAGDGLVAVWRTDVERIGANGKPIPCPICRPLDRQRQEAWADQFPFGPPAHPNCRCYLEYEPEA